MPALQVRDFPEELYEQLREYAAANHRSMAQQTIIAVEQMISSRPVAQENNKSVIFNFETEKKRHDLKKKRGALFKEINQLNKKYPSPQMSREENERLWEEQRYERDHFRDHLLPKEL